jgi:hypothetical protein
VNGRRGRVVPLRPVARRAALVRLACTVSVLAVLPAAARAQSLQGAGGGFNVQRRIYYSNAVHEQTGLWYGGAGAVRLGPLRVGVSGLMGTLSGDSGTANADVKVRTTAVTAHFAVAPGVLLGIQLEARRFEADAGITVWRLIGANARLEPGLGLAGLRALVDVAVLPASSVSNGPKLKVAIQATVGASFRPARSPITFRLGYRFERYDIAATGASPERYEQFRGLIAEAGLSLGR